MKLKKETIFVKYYNIQVEFTDKKKCGYICVQYGEKYNLKKNGKKN